MLYIGSRIVLNNDNDKVRFLHARSTYRLDQNGYRTENM